VGSQRRSASLDAALSAAVSSSTSSGCRTRARAPAQFRPRYQVSLELAGSRSINATHHPAHQVLDSGLSAASTEVRPYREACVPVNPHIRISAGRSSRADSRIPAQ
jgi:hypothetical protein